MKKKKALRHMRHPRSAPQKNKNKITVTGVFCGTRRGFGFVTPEDGGEDIFIPPAKTGGAWHGDTVRVLLKKAFDGRSEGTVDAVLAQKAQTVIGTLASERIRGSRGASRQYFIIPDDKALPEYLPLDETPPCADGDKIECRLVRGRYPYAVFLRSFGASYSFAANRDAVLAENGIDPTFSPEALREAQARASLPLSEERRERIKSPALTIDGADAKDLDDAVSLTETDEGYLLGVHIADVSEYVTPRTALDRTVMQRGTSIYFADRVIPMLPEALSNGACSLNAGEDKYTLSAEIRIDTEGNIRGVRLFRSILKSDVRGVYSEVNDLFENGENSPFAEKYAKVSAMLQKMRLLYEKLEARSAARGAFELEAPEPYFVMGENGRVADILPRARGISERMIEQFMLAANQAVAAELSTKNLPCVFRVHEAPPKDKVSDLFRTLAALDIATLPLRNDPLTAKDFAAVLREAKEKGKETAVGYLLLRSMAKASYSHERAPHFGLGVDYYCHFTSPIRRLSDLATHRIIKATLLNGEPSARYASYAHRAAAAASETELRAMSTERSMNALYCALWAEDHLQERFEATVSGITSFGVFATLDNAAEGLIPIEDLPYGSFYDEDNRSMRIGKDVLHIADRIGIRIEESSLCARRIRFSLESMPPSARKDSL